jgi:hypothetical protein
METLISGIAILLISILAIAVIWIGISEIRAERITAKK